MQVEKLKTIDADTLLSTPMNKTLFVVDGLIPQGLSVLSGSSKIGKSWLMLWLGIQVASGQPVWEFETHKSDVLYLCLEDTYKALTMSTNPKTFTYIMRRLGYVIDLNPYHKYATIRSVNSKKATRLYRLGEGYDRENIYYRMRDTSQNHWQEAYRLSAAMRSFVETANHNA